MKLDRPNGTLDITDSQFESLEQFESALAGKHPIRFSKVIMTEAQKQMLGKSPYFSNIIVEING